MEAKIELRRAIKQRLGRMTDNDRRVESQIIVRELRKRIPTTPCVIAAYFPYMDEPDIRPLLTELLEQKYVICIGKIEGQHMRMHRIHTLDDIGRNPVTNIVEPSEDEAIDEATIACAIVPGRAFTRTGLRMGRGNGGYDRWIDMQLVRNPAMKTIGVCFECQLIDDLPMESHDRPVDAVLTASVYREQDSRKN
jgi:5-formyltetrahydrofolate cyclo-ligase